MKYCRFVRDGLVRYGAVEERGGEFWITGPISAPEEDLAFQLSVERTTPENFDFDPMPMSAAKLLPPVTPQKIICVGRNYREHAKELGNEVPVEPLIFFKPPSSLLRPGGTVLLPRASSRVDYEGELVLVIGKRLRKLKEDGDLRNVIRGWTLADDVSARDLQKKDVQWARAKGFDTFCPIGPFVSDEIDPLGGVTIETRINGELRQRASTSDFIFGMRKLLSFISEAFTLEPGDIILTGTPAGVGELKPGDQVQVSIEGLGTLTHDVADEE